MKSCDKVSWTYTEKGFDVGVVLKGRSQILLGKFSAKWFSVRGYTLPRFYIKSVIRKKSAVEGVTIDR